MLTRHIREFLQVTPGPFPEFWAGPGDEALQIFLIFGQGLGLGLTSFRPFLGQFFM